MRLAYLRLLLAILVLAAFTLQIVSHSSAVIEQQTQFHKVHSNASPQARVHRSNIIMVSFIFGEKAAHKKYLKMFLESARASGIDIVIIGSPVPPFPLPHNVKHIQITWKELTARISERLFDGKRLSKLESAAHYKVIDVKPLFAFLFPDVVHGYDWWGHMDNDLILGNASRLLMHNKILADCDIICPMTIFPTTGPFMLYRNSNETNELFRRSPLPLVEIFNKSENVAFDEIGWAWDYNMNGTKYSASMSGIVDRYADELGLRQCRGLPFEYDGAGRRDLGRPCTSGIGRPCPVCSITLPANRSTKQKVICDGKELLFYHFLFGKRAAEGSLQNESLMDSLLRDGRFQLDARKGFVPITRFSALMLKLLHWKRRWVRLQSQQL